MTIVTDNDPLYQTELAVNPGRIVCNSTNPVSGSYLMAHRPNCSCINGTPANGQNWTHNQAKLFVDTLEELDRWTTRRFARVAQRCSRCLWGA